ncbi:molybdate ABC transporter substrate-binding protein [Knoellia sp. LjRoot47]|uniref:molybdate ABC transporter substrate-binding protein n=1 Tax=Knoellia sp. LjRoot47 TaxID=3342330 RepID=UPI003ECF24A3
MKAAYAVRAAAAAGASAVLLALAGCGGGDNGADRGEVEPRSGGSATPTTARTLTVFAAASLQKPFEEIGGLFEDTHPGVTVRFSFGGSSGLVAQLSEGAPADVLATANESTMAKAVADDLVAGDPEPFVSNTLQIVVPADNPAKVTGLADLAKPGTKVVLCAPAVPCGAASADVEKAAGIDITPVSEEQSVTDVLGKVRSGEADAGLVYVTDVAGAGDEVTGIDFPEATSAVNVYPIGTLKAATDVTLAREFVGVVSGSEGLEILADAGFTAP